MESTVNYFCRAILVFIISTILVTPVSAVGCSSETTIAWPARLLVNLQQRLKEKLVLLDPDIVHRSEWVFTRPLSASSVRTIQELIGDEQADGCLTIEVAEKFLEFDITRQPDQ